MNPDIKFNLKNAKKKIIIGADGVGTKTNLAAADSEGNVLGYCSCGGINYNYDRVEQCRQNLKSGIKNLLKSIEAPDYDYLSVGHCALSEAATEGEKKFFCGDVFDPGKILLQSDVHMALTGAFPLSDGVMAVSGTGSMCVAKKGGKTLVSGGWGYLLGDEGSCYYIAWRGIAGAARYFDGTGDRTSVTEKLMDYCKITDIRDIIPWLYAPPVDVGKIAGFAKHVIQCFREGDAVAENIISDALGILAKTVSRLIEKLEMKNGAIGMYGGLFERNPDIAARFCAEMKLLYPAFTVGFPEFEPELGAIIYYFAENGILTGNILD
ncbi:MAG: hypothetical protein FWD23_17305, partial [Oscillospiraceae bacterium]|nr:hypothetical protein [Oscillospiraceae bacterium]